MIPSLLSFFFFLSFFFLLYISCVTRIIDKIPNLASEAKAETVMSLSNEDLAELWHFSASEVYKFFFSSFSLKKTNKTKKETKKEKKKKRGKEQKK